MLLFLICTVIAAPFSLWYLTNTDAYPSTLFGWAVTSIVSVPLTFIGYAMAFMAWLALLWAFSREPFGFALFLAQSKEVQFLIFVTSFSGAGVAAILIEGVARWRAQRRRARHT